MKKQIALFLGLIFSVSGAAFAQTPTVTNADLEKFRQKRIKAEREYRENYEKMGFPSPEELEAQIEQSRIERAELSARLEMQQENKENFYHARADALRTEIASVRSQLAYLRGQIPASDVFIDYSRYSALGVVPGFGRRALPRHDRFSGGGARQTATIAPAKSPIRANIRTGSVFREKRQPPRVSIDISTGRYDRRGAYRNPYFYGGFPIVVDNTDYKRRDLNAGLRFLEQQLAGLLGEWRVLEDQARRAGVKIY